ncbi:hypothetical protein PMF13cell1_00621 [Blautia producta]|uniref:Uncharacterized protein n=2 Tax=Blautia producta TaxID=33035 RepID=A0A4P6LT48_9FIRM|nr:hypothetical protein PMF13cell1_00621 [Blautia producta]
MKDELDAKWAEGFAEGRALGRALVILDLLKDLGEVSEELQRKIMEQSDTEVLNQWLIYAAWADTIQEFEQKIQ